MAKTYNEISQEIQTNITSKTEAKSITKTAVGGAINDVLDFSKSFQDTIYGDLYESESKTVEWVDDLIATNGSYRARTGKKTSKPILLKSGEKVNVSTSGDAGYVMSVICKVASADSQVAAGYNNTSLVNQSGAAKSNYTYTAAEDTYITISGSSTDCEVTFDNLEPSKPITDSIEDDLDELEESTNNKIDAINGELYHSYDKVVSYVSGLVVNSSGSIASKSVDKVSNVITLYKDEKVIVKTKGDGAYIFSIVSKVDDINFVPAAGLRVTSLVAMTNNNLTTYTYTATEDVEYIVVSVLDDSTTSVTFDNIKKFSRITELEEESLLCGSILKNKSVMFFGDSLTAASSNGVKGFAKIIAENCGMPYRAFLYDRGEGGTSDVDVTYKCFTNYAKDGTTNRTMSSRTDSVVEKIKRIVSNTTNVDYILVECCVNDVASTNRNKGELSSSYEDFETSTTIGAIEEVIRYVTTLNSGVRLGFYIPWNITWAEPTFFDEYANIFKKWGVPYIDLRTSSGFNIKDCSAHSLLYSLSADQYAAYSSSTTYNLDDKVKYSGSLYKCTANGVVGVPPTDTTKWILVGSSSSDGTHLNSIGHKIVAGKIQNFLESL